MPARVFHHFEEQTGITTTGDAFIVNPAKQVSVATLLTAGTPATGCKVQITNDDPLRIQAGSAAWVDSPMGTHVISAIEKILGPVTGVRVVVTDGTWTFQVRQV